MKKNQKGFSVVEMLLIFVIIGLIGGLGWYVWSKRNMTTSTSSESTISKNSEVTQQATPDPTSSWLLAYTSQNKKFSVFVPDGWKLSSPLGSDSLHAWSASEIQFKAGTIAEVQTVEGGRDGSSIAFFMSYANNVKELYLTSEYQKVKSYKTDSGITVDKYTRTQTKEPDGLDLPKGTIEYRYVLTLNSKLIVVSHDVLSGETEQSALIEQMIETVKFL